MSVLCYVKREAIDAHAARSQHDASGSPAGTAARMTNIGALSAFLRRWGPERSQPLRRIDSVPPEDPNARPASAIAAASLLSGVSVEQTFAALRQESEELQRLQVAPLSPHHTLASFRQPPLRVPWRPRPGLR